MIGTPSVALLLVPLQEGQFFSYFSEDGGVQNISRIKIYRTSMFLYVFIRLVYEQ